jgi:hypothetical protein
MSHWRTYLVNICMQSLKTIINAFWQIALFRAGPDSLPDSRPLLVLAMVVYILVDITVILTLYPRHALPPLLLVDVGFLLLWCAGILRLFGFAQRIQQTLIALFGTGALLQLLAFPLSAWPSFGLPIEIPLFLRVLVSVAILLWSVSVYGHIFAKAISRSMGIGISFAIIYFIVIYEFAAQWGQVN